MEISAILLACFLIAVFVSVFIFIHKDHKAWIKSEAEEEALKKHKKAIKQKEEEEAKKVAKRIAEQKLAHSKKYDEVLSFRTYELAKLTKTILDGVDLKDLTDVLPILESQAFQGKAVNEFLDDLSAQFRDAIVERVNASASDQGMQMDYSDARISAKVDDLVATCIEMGRPILLTKLEIKDAGNFDGVNKSKIGKTKKWDQSHSNH
jgi:DNA-binding ferritin-like protein (Dps family)